MVHVTRPLIFRIVILVVAIVSTLIGYVRCDPSTFNDTISYIDASYELASGNIDVFRTPGYPLLIALCRFTVGDAWQTLILGLQIATYFISIPVFARLAYLCLRSESRAFVATLFYAAYPSYSLFNFLVATEPLATSSTVFTLWIVCCYIKKMSFGRWVALTVSGLWLIALRPSLSVIIVAYASLAILLIFSTQYRRQAYGLFTSAAAVCVICVPYVIAIERETGVYTFSTVSIVNEYACNRAYGDIFPDYFEDPEVMTLIAENDSLHGHEAPNGIYMEILAIQNRIGWSGIDAYNKQIRLNNPGHMLKLAGKRFIDSFASIGYRKNVFFYAVTLAYSILIICRSVRRRQIFPMESMLAIFSFGVILTAVIGAQNDWARLIIPMTPVAFIMTCSLLKVTKDTNCLS